MSSITKSSLHCVSSGCNLASEVICRHCHEQYCYLCFMCHRKSLIGDMKSISEQMTSNRQQGVTEVVSFIDRQAKDAHEQAKKLIDDAVDRIIKSSEHIYTYIENRRSAKLGRLDECLEKFDKDAEFLNSKISRQLFLPADLIQELRQKYAYNMFDTSVMTPLKTDCNDIQRKSEKFFNNYRNYNELINLRQKWTFLQAALTTVYFPGKKDFALDKIITFLEYRHDRVLENYRDYLSTNKDSHESALKSTEELLNQLSFLPKKDLIPQETCNFTYINEIATDSGHGDDDEATSSGSCYSWQVEDEEKRDELKNQIHEQLKDS